MLALSQSWWLSMHQFWVINEIRCHKWKSWTLVSWGFQIFKLSNIIHYSLIYCASKYRENLSACDFRKILDSHWCDLNTMAFAAARMIKEKKEQESRKSSSSRTMNKVTTKVCSTYNQLYEERTKPFKPLMLINVV